MRGVSPPDIVIIVMNRRLLLAAALSGAVAGLNPAQAAQPLATLTGTVTGYDASSTLLSVNGRLGVEQFIVPTSAQILLNGRASTVQAIQVGDEVTVRYDYNTARAVVVRVFREAKRQVTINTVSSTGMGLRLPSGNVVAAKIDAASQITLEGFQVSNNAVLVGRSATAIYEPGTFLILSLAVNGQVFKGRATAVDSSGRTVTLAGTQSLTFAVDTNATITRNGSAATLAQIVVGDQVKTVFVKNAAGRRSLLLKATGANSS